ncbi:golgi uridine diphosphate-N- acetylglucosamine transporter [Serendipita sp. 405]|nr:golgi uridine diphosphate-N- acetylglucosamine transporter [Serendipita sp. 405]
MTSVLALAAARDWSVILGFIFGGCCSNAWATEVATSQNPNAGSLMTLAQFLIVSLMGLPSQLCFVPSDSKTKETIPFTFRSILRQPTRILSVRFKPRAIPISRWIIQVVLFLLTSLLNNAVFKFDIPMYIHIIFRSAGLVTNLLLGYFFAGKRYTSIQIVSVLIVTLGVFMTTFSTRPRRVDAASLAKGEDNSNIDYMIGIAILTGALVLSSAMGLAQDQAYAEYGRGHWREGLFYLHFLALPMFAPLWPDVQEQVRIANASPIVNATALFGTSKTEIGIPVFWIPLVLNIITQLVCVSGVHRLTARVSSLTVTLVLAVRKAVSLVLSVMLIGKSGGNAWLWGGSFFVLAGTILYTLDGTKPPQREPSQVSASRKQE